eukprot:6182753-Pleurochrysis_carterae.AAC.1
MAAQRRMRAQQLRLRPAMRPPLPLTMPPKMPQRRKPLHLAGASKAVARPRPACDARRFSRFDSQTERGGKSRQLFGCMTFPRKISRQSD